MNYREKHNATRTVTIIRRKGLEGFSNPLIFEHHMFLTPSTAKEHLRKGSVRDIRMVLKILNKQYPGSIIEIYEVPVLEFEITEEMLKYVENKIPTDTISVTDLIGTDKTTILFGE